MSYSLDVLSCFRYRQLQVQNDSHITELQSDVKLKSFEFERLQLVHDETKRNLKACELEKEKLAKKVEVRTYVRIYVRT